jgi:hypothetical protein
VTLYGDRNQSRRTRFSVASSGDIHIRARMPPISLRALRRGIDQQLGVDLYYGKHGDDSAEVKLTAP